jgi:hypothetical protein
VSRGGGRLMGGASAIVTSGGIEILIQIDSNYIQILSNYDRSKKDISELENFEIKYGWEGFEEKNNFFHWNFSRSEMDFKWKFREISWLGT